MHANIEIYNYQLPIYLKPCLWKSTSHGSSEGFIRAASGKTLEETAESFLDDLIERNLVMVKKRGLTGKVKTCNIHDLVRDLCKREAVSLKFLCIPMRGSPTTPTNSSHMERACRMIIHVGTADEKLSARGVDISDTKSLILELL